MRFDQLTKKEQRHLRDYCNTTSTRVFKQAIPENIDCRYCKEVHRKIKESEEKARKRRETKKRRGIK